MVLGSKGKGEIARVIYHKKNSKNVGLGGPWYTLWANYSDRSPPSSHPKMVVKSKGSVPKNSLNSGLGIIVICPDISPLIGDMNPRKTHLFSASFMGIKTSFITGFFWAHLAGMIGLFAQTKLLGSVYCRYCWVVATQIYFMSAPNFGEDSHFGSYFFWDGLVQPPTSIGCVFFGDICP